MENNEQLEVTKNENLTEVTDEVVASPSEIDENQSIEDSPVEVNENETVERKSKKKKSATIIEDIFTKGDRVSVDESKNPEWSNGSKIPHWIYNRRFYIVNIDDDNNCEISLDLNGKVSGKINSKFLIKINGITNKTL